MWKELRTAWRPQTTQVFIRTTETSEGPARHCTMWSMPAMVSKCRRSCCSSAHPFPSRVEALLTLIGGTRDPLWAVLRQDKYARVCVCVQTVCLFFTYLNMFILYTTTLMSPCYLLYVIYCMSSTDEGHC